jgi:hypothetical protein
MTSVMVELVTMYNVDGFNHNRWAPQRMCYCDWCRTNFRRATGLELPLKEEPGAKGYSEYVVWRENRIFDLWDHWNASIRKVNPNAFVLPGIGAERDRLNMSKIRSRAKTLYLDYQARRGTNGPWMAGKKGRELAAVLGHNLSVSRSRSDMRSRTVGRIRFRAGRRSKCGSATALRTACGPRWRSSPARSMIAAGPSR